MSVMRRQAGIAVLVAASVALGLLAVGYHAHGLPVVHAHDRTIDACADVSVISAVCTVCTLVHVSPAPDVDCLGVRARSPEQRLGALDVVALPVEPVLCSHASRAPPAPQGLEV